jgi:hypothetical protein
MTRITKMDFNRDEGDTRDDFYLQISFIPFIPVESISTPGERRQSSTLHEVG